MVNESLFLGKTFKYPPSHPPNNLEAIAIRKGKLLKFNLQWQLFQEESWTRKLDNIWESSIAESSYRTPFPHFITGHSPEDDEELSSRRLSCFLCFMRRFWNHVFTCVSLRPSADASSTLSGVERYLWASNLFSNPVSWGSLNTVLAFRRRQCLRAPIPSPKAKSGHPFPGNRGDPAKIPATEIPMGTLKYMTLYQGLFFLVIVGVNWRKTSGESLVIQSNTGHTVSSKLDAIIQLFPHIS